MVNGTDRYMSRGHGKVAWTYSKTEANREARIAFGASGRVVDAADFAKHPGKYMAGKYAPKRKALR